MQSFVAQAVAIEAGRAKKMKPYTAAAMLSPRVRRGGGRGRVSVPGDDAGVAARDRTYRGTAEYTLWTTCRK